MILYLDTSALVKLLVEEDASPEVRAAVRMAGTCAQAIHETAPGMAFACFDERLNQGAKAEGMRVLQG